MAASDLEVLIQADMVRAAEPVIPLYPVTLMCSLTPSSERAEPNLPVVVRFSKSVVLA